MNAAILLMGSAWMAGADTAQPPPAAAMPAPGGPVAVSTGAGCGGGGCGGCGPVVSGGCCDPCASAKHGLFSRFGNRGSGGLFGKHKGNDCCAPAPTCCAPAPTCCAPPAPTCCAPAAPVYVGCTTACCDTCGKQGLFSKLKGRMGGKHKGGDCCDTGCGGYGAGYGGGYAASPCATPLPAGAAPAPVPVPGGTTPPKEMPKPKTGSGAAAAPIAPVTPVGGPALSGTTSPY